MHADPDTCDGKCHGACQRYFEAEQQVFASEKVLLGLRAFRPIRMTPENAAAEPLLADAGKKATPRIVILDVARSEADALHGGKLTAGRVYAAMKKAASRFYRESLDGRVKKHLKFLGEHDKLAPVRFRLEEQISLTGDDRRAKKLEKKLDELRESQRKLDQAIEDLWELALKPL